MYIMRYSFLNKLLNWTCLGTPMLLYPLKEVEMFYEDIAKAMEENRTHYMYRVGDFNAKLGKSEVDSETGNFSYEMNASKFSKTT